MTAAPRPAPARDRRTLMLLGMIVALHLAVELALWGGDRGFWATARLRPTAYEYGGFWPGLLRGWRPNYPGQPVAMFLTYGLLHGGPGHAAVNMLTLWSLGGMVVDWVGRRGLLLVYLAALLGGGVGYAVLARTPQPMVGASGALFGLAGGLMVWAVGDRTRTDRAAAGRLLVLILGFLVAVNLTMWWALDGQIAWQTHLGGFVAGSLCALLLRPVSP